MAPFLGSCATLYYKTLIDVMQYLIVCMHVSVRLWKILYLNVGHLADKSQDIMFHWTLNLLSLGRIKLARLMNKETSRLACVQFQIVYTQC